MSQLGADTWVLSLFNAPGYFVDVGCADGEKINNTYLLEQNGWKGICIDAFPKNFANRPNSIVEKAVLYSEKDVEVDFIVPNEPELSGIPQHLSHCFRDRVINNAQQQYKFKTALLTDILDKHGAPSFINYLSLDIEGAEYEVLRTFNFDKYKFGTLSIEHNYDEPRRTQIRDLMTEKGYSLCKDVAFDDWYVKTDLSNYT